MYPFFRKKTALCWLLFCCLLLSSCASNIPLHGQEAPALTLPPARPAYVAPIGDAALEYAAPATLFLPRHDSMQLSAVMENIIFTVAKPQAESLVRALLGHEGNSLVSSVGGSVKLSLYGANPVEVSRDVATVNLAASALQLDRKAFYLASQAIANTLTELPSIHYVNVLVMDKCIGLDIAGTLPMGSFTRNVGDDIGAMYEQLLAQRTASSQDPVTKGLTSLVTLYFPLAQLDGILSETRPVSFDSQAPKDVVVRLLQELAAGPQPASLAPALPLLADLLTAPPAISDAPEGGGKLITLRFSHNFDDMLSAFQLNRATAMGAIDYTLCTFLPGITGVTFYVGDQRVENVLVRGTEQVAILFHQAVQHRADYSAFLMDMGTLYLADDSGQKLLQIERPMPYYQTRHPRALLLELAKGPQAFDSMPAQPLMKTGALKDSDLVGFSLSGNALVVNFAPTFALVGQGFSSQQDRLLAYGLVNTLSSFSRIRRVCFFVTGEMPEGFSGDIYWAGDFYKNMGLVRQGP